MTQPIDTLSAYAAGSAFGVIVALAGFNFVYGVLAGSKRLVGASTVFAGVAIASAIAHYASSIYTSVYVNNSAVPLGAGLLVLASSTATVWSVWKIQLVSLRNAKSRDDEFRRALAVQEQRRRSLQSKSAELFQINASLEQENAARARTEIQLRNALDNESAALLEHGRFVQMLSHEFRTPLAVIDASSHLLAGHEQGRNGPYEKRLSRIRRSLSRLVELVEDCLNDKRLVAEELVPDVIDFDLRSSIRDACTYLEEQVGRVVLHHNATSLPVRGDPALIAVAINNLVENALQYSTPGTDVVVSCDVSDRVVRVDVENSGEPIPDDEKDRIFQRYFRGSYATRSLSLNESREFFNSGAHELHESLQQPEVDAESGGVGLGLYLARKIARNHSGDVLLVSSSQGKNVMRLELPLVSRLQP